MKKIALVFIVAVLAPSLVLAWLALRSLRDQELVFERQQELLYQGTTDRIAEQIRAVMSEAQSEFGDRVEALTQDRAPRSLAPVFDEEIRAAWPLAEVGFCATLDGTLLAPSLIGSVEAKNFRDENEPFLRNRARAEVYQNGSLRGGNAIAEQSDALAPAGAPSLAKSVVNAPQSDRDNAEPQPQAFRQKTIQRSVSPLKEPRPAETQLSNVLPSEAEFRQIVGDATSGTVARFLQNQLRVLVWHRAARDPQLIFGAQMSLDRLKQRLRELIRLEDDLAQIIGIALLDDSGKPVAKSAALSVANWKRPFVATEIGEALPHWELAAYLLDPSQLDRSAASLRRAIGSMIAVMLLAICGGAWLLAADVRRQLALARQKTDFVSNVSHELKTPLTSIRMFSELLAERRVEGAEKQQEYSQIIAFEASRLTRLINNVLDFARLERGEKTYDRRAVRLDELVEETLAHYRPQLEAGGYRVECDTQPMTAHIDRDAIAQVLLNLVSNAEKYGGETKEISVTMRQHEERGEILVCDRGLGVPPGGEEKIFEQFHRAHDALNSGIQGAGLGLTLARQIARAHGGDIIFTRREGGGSCFGITLPLAPPPV